MNSVSSEKTNRGNFFEDFVPRQVIRHPFSITMSAADTLNARGLYGARLPVCTSDTFAKSVGYTEPPISNMVVFHTVFGLTVPDISKNARANLGYAEVSFLEDVMPGDTLSAHTSILGLKENSNGKTGVVWVHTTGVDQTGRTVCSFKRWVMIKKREEGVGAVEATVPKLADHVDPATISVSPVLAIPRGTFDTTVTGADHAWEDYQAGEMIDHDASVQMVHDHMVATRLAGGNNAAVHFDALTQLPSAGKSDNPTKDRLIYGGHIMQHAFAQTNNGFENTVDLVAINGGAHVAPTFEGDTIRSYSKVIQKARIEDRDDLALLRLRTVALKNHARIAIDPFPYKQPDPSKPGEETYHPSVVLDLDYWISLPTSKSLADHSKPAAENHKLNPVASAPIFAVQPAPERAVHFFPPHIKKMRAKAADLVGRVDVLLGNLEDGVGPDKKIDARHGFIQFARDTEMGASGLWTRINALDTAWGKDDVQEIVSTVGQSIDVIMLPMVREPEEITELQRMLVILEADAGITKPIRIHAILETGSGIVNVNEIAKVMNRTGRGHGISFGPADYAASLGIKTQDVGGSIASYGVLGRQPAEDVPGVARQFTQQDVWHYHISAMVAACRAYGLKPLYGPFGNFGDADACRQQFLNAYLMGCEGAWTLHPNQIEIALEVFAPSSSDVETAVRRIRRFEASGSVSYYESETGKFVDEAVIKQADVFVKLARQLADRDPYYADFYAPSFTTA